ncbi:MAG: glycerate kinase [Candidatus Hydrogenedentes bacterium]|nr:glycerate kinase [Candidatus Hydrogenedentota bacterium]
MKNPPRIVIAPDSFKECLSALEVAEALARGVRRAIPGAAIEIVPMADGGEGTVDALVAGSGGTLETCRVTGPLGEPVDATFGMLGDGTTAIIEMAAASGLGLVAPEVRDPRHASTFGTGELLRAALDRGARRIILGIGGSATNDGGAGMAEALGYALLDEAGQPLPRGGAMLAHLARIDASGKDSRLAGCEVLVACDVTNPLCGPQGASAIYGPQKGATPRMVEELDAALRHFADVVLRQLGVAILDVPGAGAAGGLGGGLMAFANGRLRPGVELVADVVHLEERVRGAALVITGEGRLDAQTPNGKTPVGVARVAKRCGVPVVAIAGSLGGGYEQVYAHGIDAAFSICTGPMTLDYSRANAARLLEEAGEAVGRMWQATSRRG